MLNRPPDGSFDKDNVRFDGGVCLKWKENCKDKREESALMVSLPYFTISLNFSLSIRQHLLLRITSFHSWINQVYRSFSSHELSNLCFGNDQIFL